MSRKVKLLSLAIAGVSLAVPLTILARQNEARAKTEAPDASAAVAPISPAQLLSDRLAGVKATSEAREYNGETLVELGAERAAAHREYRVVTAAARFYGTVRVDVLSTENAIAAFGLFTYSAGAIGARAVEKNIGSDSANAPGEVIFWKNKYVVRVLETAERRSAARGTLALIASAIAAAIGNGADDVRPALLESLPRDSKARGSERYLLGPESLSAFVSGGREMFDFAGRAEAVLAEYPQNGTGMDLKGDPPGAAVKLLIVECHTPQFATDALARVTAHIESLPEDQQQRMIVKREGNYIVEAIGFDNPEFAQQLVDSVKYPYTVKWLRNPLWPTNDPWRMQKAAQMLLSTFGLIGLMALGVLIGGGAVGTAIFLKRRKRQREVFSDAGGMLRLDLDPFDAVILGLPPARSGDD